MYLEKFHLAWDKFQASASKTFNNLFEDQDFTDVTLVCDDDKQIKAHKVILSSSSSFFRNILIRNPHKHPLLYLKGISYSDLQSVVKFLYFGEAEIAQDSLETFLVAAKELEIEGLMNTELEINKEEEGFELKHYIDLELDNSESVNDEVDSYSVLPAKTDELEMVYNDIMKTGQIDKLSCEQCEKTFTQPGTLNRHKKTVHGGVRYFCDQCQRKFSQSGKLSQHIKIVHSSSTLINS